MEKRQEVKKGTKKLGNKGFSLVELIVVIAIMAILTVVIAPQFMRYIEKSRVSVDKQTLESINSSIQAALADESAWDAFATATGPVTVKFNNDGKAVTTASTGIVTALDRTYNSVGVGAGVEFEQELNKNLNKTISFKSKDCKAGITFTIDNKTKEITNDAVFAN